MPRRRRSGRAWEEGFGNARCRREDKRSRGLEGTSRALERRRRSRGRPPPKRGTAPTTPASVPPASSLPRADRIALRCQAPPRGPSPARAFQPTLPATRPTVRPRRLGKCQHPLKPWVILSRRLEACPYKVPNIGAEAERPEPKCEGA